MHQGCIWWPAEQKICRQTKITSKEHLGWGIAGGLVNGTPVGKQEKEQFLVSVLLVTEYQEKGAVQDGPIELLYHANRNFSHDWSAVIEGPRIGKSSVELEPLQQSRSLGWK
ncbi:hypothetical protein TNCV_4670661 [Trichonephila clavipes]|nr:hypothetical protein TNCV_4670661 [Trichonephila clavipes]